MKAEVLHFDFNLTPHGIPRVCANKLSDKKGRNPISGSFFSFSLKLCVYACPWFNKYFRTQFGVKIFSAAIAASQHAVCIFIPTQIVTVVSLKKGLCSILFRKFPHSWQHNDKPPITVFVATVTF